MKFGHKTLDILGSSKLQFSQCALEELCQWYSSSPTAGFMWNEIPRFFFLPSPTSMPSIAAVCSARLAARWEKLSHSKFLLSPNAQCGKMHEKVAFCMHAPYDLTWPLHFRCFLSVFVLELLRQLPAWLPAYMPACLQTVNHILVCPVGESQQKTDPLKKDFAATGKYVYYFQTYSLLCLYIYAFYLLDCI